MNLKEECTLMAEKAEADESYTQRCIEGEKVFYVEADEAVIPGHIYSVSGRDEFFISRSCEYHFDAWFKEED